MKKIAILSHVLPPSPSGQATVLFRLLKELDPSLYLLIKSPGGQSNQARGEDNSELKCQRFEVIDPILEFLRGSDQIKRFFRRSYHTLIFSPYRIIHRAIQIRNILRSQRCDVLLVCTGDFEDIPAGFIASRLNHIPFFLYYFDWYGFQWLGRVKRFIALRMESMIIRRMDKLIVPNIVLYDDIKEVYGVEATIIHNPYDERASVPQRKVKWPSEEAEIRIVYTGAIYHANFDAFINLSLALRDFKRPETRIHIYTNQSPSELEKHGIDREIVIHPHLSPVEVLDVQHHADILFLPLTFKSNMYKVIRTSAPGKMSEYLASGRPIMVHGPEDAFVSRYFRMHNCGMVVDLDSPNHLKRGVERLLNDERLRLQMIDNASTRANEDFNPRLEREKLRHLLWDGA